MNNKPNINLIYILIVAVLASIAAGIIEYQYRLVIRTLNPISITNTTPQPTPSYDPQVLYDTVVKQFYQARIEGNEQKALSYFSENLISLKKDVFSYLEKNGWKFVNSKFQSFEMVYGKGNKFIMRIKNNDGTIQDELVYVGKYPKEDAPKIIDISFNPKGFSVLSYQDTPYLILQTLERDNPVKQKIFLTTKYFEHGCSLYINHECSIFIETAGSLRKFTDISEVSQYSLFQWSSMNSNEIIYDKGFGEGTGGYESVESIDINSGNKKVLINKELGSAVNMSPIGRELMEQECYSSTLGDIWSLERSNKDSDYIEFFYCRNKNYYLEYYTFIISNNRLLKKELVSENEMKNPETVFNLDIEKNIFNSGQFTFLFRGVNYVLNINTGELKTL